MLSDDTYPDFFRDSSASGTKASLFGFYRELATLLGLKVWDYRVQSFGCSSGFIVLVQKALNPGIRNPKPLSLKPLSPKPLNP